jgi:hypothetical protein
MIQRAYNHFTRVHGRFKAKGREDFKVRNQGSGVESGGTPLFDALKGTAKNYLIPRWTSIGEQGGNDIFRKIFRLQVEYDLDFYSVVTLRKRGRP